MWHPLLLDMKPHFERTRDCETGILRPFKRLLVDVMSSKVGLDAALGAADRLYQVLVLKGHRVTIAPMGGQLRRAEVDLREVPRKNNCQARTWSPERPTVVYIDEVAIGLTLFEMTEETEMQYVGNSTYVPVSRLTEAQRRRCQQSQYWTSTQDKASGRLRLQAYCPSGHVSWTKQWTETKPGQFSSMVPEIVRELEATGPELAAKLEAAKVRAEERRRKWAEEERLRREAEARALQEKRLQESRSDLRRTIAAWNEERAIAAFFAEVESAAEQLATDDQHRLLERVSLAKRLLDERSPLELLLQWKGPYERG